jgi:hypothetical protein
MGHMMDGLAMKYINKYFKHISNERHVLIYLFKAHFKDFLYVDEKVLIFYFGSMKVMIN